eukprot:GHVT01011025.1.p1 GENE.GHVT01011025.1~~GHVT01011025.1.p1  ORF type:complete len:199 (+),score=24.87 GHVT01011025.1:631-1227(+)
MEEKTDLVRVQNVSDAAGFPRPPLRSHDQCVAMTRRGGRVHVFDNRILRVLPNGEIEDLQEVSDKCIILGRVGTSIGPRPLPEVLDSFRDKVLGTIWTEGVQGWAVPRARAISKAVLMIFARALNGEAGADGRWVLFEGGTGCGKTCLMENIRMAFPLYYAWGETEVIDAHTKVAYKLAYLHDKPQTRFARYAAVWLS